MAELNDLDRAQKRISNAWWAALISATVTVIFAFISLRGEPVAGIDAWAFLDVALLLGLAFGLSRRSRVCAILLLLYFLASKILMWKEAGNVNGLPVALVFIWYFAQGVVGTFQYHALVATFDSAPAATHSQPNTAYRPAGLSRGTPWLVWTILAVSLLAVAGGGWYTKAKQQEAIASSDKALAQQDMKETATSSIGRLVGVDTSGRKSPLSAAIAVEEGVMLAPCRGISPGTILYVNVGARELQAKLDKVDAKGGPCKLTLKDVGSWPLVKATASPKVGDAVYAASFEPSGKVTLLPGAVKKLVPVAGGTVIESSARAGEAMEGSPLLDATGRVIAIQIEGRDTALPSTWTANWPTR